MSVDSTRQAAWFAPWLLVLGCVGFASAWILLAYARGATFAWLGIVAALDIALLLRLGRVRRGWRRALAGVLVTALTIVATAWGTLAALTGAPLGLLPWESMSHLGPHLARTLFPLVYDGIDLAWFGASLVVAAVVSR
ncbi:hypothetical protein [Luteimonas vadosa]|uniref:Lycopene cyclase domain-containing protein n=1 Tax=Luteimonas vadosa TaxID=1165507 RepID=A0ABP9E9R3_9GAMM